MFTVSGPASRVLYSLDDLVYGKIISTTNMLRLNGFAGEITMRKMEITRYVDSE